MINKICTMQLVRVVSCTNAGNLAAVGFVDVQILVNQIDGYGNPTPHGIVHGLPYMRLQGGANAIIIDPLSGDIGHIMCSSHDFSNVVSTQGQANPGSRRRFSYSDAVYVGGELNGAPTQFIQFLATGINMVDANGNRIAMGPSGVAITAPTLTHNGVPIGATHVHGGVQTGASDTGAPV